MNFIRIENDINGNPRYILHVLDVINLEDLTLSENYDTAEMILKKIGVKKYRKKGYEYNFVFQSYNIGSTKKEIESYVNAFYKVYKAYRNNLTLASDKFKKLDHQIIQLIANQ